MPYYNKKKQEWQGLVRIQKTKNNSPKTPSAGDNYLSAGVI